MPKRKNPKPKGRQKKRKQPTNPPLDHFFDASRYGNAELFRAPVYRRRIHQHTAENPHPDFTAWFYSGLPKEELIEGMATTSLGTGMEALENLFQKQLTDSFRPRKREAQ